MNKSSFSLLLKSARGISPICPSRLDDVKCTALIIASTEVVRILCALVSAFNKSKMIFNLISAVAACFLLTRHTSCDSSRADVAYQVLYHFCLINSVSENCGSFLLCIHKLRTPAFLEHNSFRTNRLRPEPFSSSIFFTSMSVRQYIGDIEQHLVIIFAHLLPKIWS